MSVQTKAEVLTLLQAHRYTLQRLGVKRCGLFGSFVRDANIQAQSDVDVLVTFEPSQKTFDNFMQLSFFLEDIFNRKIDLVTPESLSPFISPHILSEVEDVPLDL